MALEEAKKIIEAALFMSPTALKTEDFGKIARGYKAEEIRLALELLRKEFNERDTSLKVIESMNGWQMAVKEEYEDKVIHLAASSQFNKSILRTLAFIAYKEPLKQSALIKLRNNKAYDHIKLLEAKGFIQRKQEGQTYLVSTTNKFRQYFGEDAVELIKAKPAQKEKRELG
ncbi:SMC-Scp complex subunit ScpB [archaeon]|nr:SMC-Scp complex subunit ScpB [archaeon]